MKPAVQLVVGFVVAAGLMAAAVWLWLHNLIILGAPVGALAIGAAWATVDNTLIYPGERARREAAAAQTVDSRPDTPAELPHADSTSAAELHHADSPSAPELTVPH